VNGQAYVFIDCPVKNIVVLKSLSDKKIPKDLAEVRVVGLVVKPQRAGVVEVYRELVGEPTAKNFGRGSHFLLHDSIVLLLLSCSLQALPRQRTTTEVQHHVA